MYHYACMYSANITFIYSFSAGLTQDILEPSEAFKSSFIKNEDNLNFKLLPYLDKYNNFIILTHFPPMHNKNHF